ncbi:MAG TPA: zinc metallopeptidase [Chloroflexi bacterium]|nr:zinc metallopeptidase [Chloroflexota bacterium]
MFWNPTYYLFALPAFLLALYAQWKVRTAYRQYMRVPNAAGVTGLDAARLLLARTGLGVRIEGVRGTLTDHYDPRTKTLRLSPGVAQSASVGALAIVAHEVGHAMQDAQAFALLRLRSGLVPIVNFTSWLGPILFMIGWFMNYQPLASLGVVFFSGAVVFSLLTLPVELDASRRGTQLLEETKLVSGDEDLKGARRVLSAAALTYVAALAQSVSTMLYYLFLLSGSSRRRRRL